MTKSKIKNKSKFQISNNKTLVLVFVIGILNLFCALNFDICHLYAQQDNNKLVTLIKQIMEAKTNEELYPAFKELKDLYFSKNQYNEFVEFLKSLSLKKKTIEPIINYYVGFSRYQQLKYLEKTQDWDEYFNQGNAYREEIIAKLKETVDSTSPKDTINLYAQLILWQFHKDQDDAFSDDTLQGLWDSIFIYATSSSEAAPIKKIADQLLMYNEKTKAKELYRLYVEKIATSNIKDEELNYIALDSYKEGNLELTQSIFDVYIERLTKSAPKEELIPILIDIAKLFVFQEEMAKDAFYAEKIFQKIEDMAGRDAFDEGLMYLRAFNLEKAKEYAQAKAYYLDLVSRFPLSIHQDEANFKIGLIYTYILADIKTGKIYFEKLAQKETLSPHLISSFYQLGLLSQWEEDFIKAKDYYNKLIERAGENFSETLTLTKERLKEIEEAKPIEYNLKIFLDVSLKQDYQLFDRTKLDLRSTLYRLKKDQETNITSLAYLAESGCMQVELQYLWSGHLGKAKPLILEPSFNTSYLDQGTKEINLIVVSPSGIIDRNMDMLDVY